MGIEVIRGGLQTTVQDLGRPGWGRHGVARGGALDPISFHIANLLVGNDPHAAGLEFTLIGPTLRFHVDCEIAICGADMSVRCENRLVPLHRPVSVTAGSELAFGSALTGCRAYLAVRGGFAIDPVLGSCSTDLPASFGGYQGCALQTGDRLEVHAAPSQNDGAARGEGGASTRWGATGRLTSQSPSDPIRILSGRHRELFVADAFETLQRAEFEVAAESNRVGYRLLGPSLRLKRQGELRSEAVLPGTIQVPPNGQPIVLLADGPVTGGYAKLGQVVTADLPRLAQLRPGSRLRLREVSLSTAQDLLHRQDRDLALLRTAIRWKCR